MTTYFDAVDSQRLLREFPMGDDFIATFSRLSREALTVVAEITTGTDSATNLLPIYQELLKSKLGIAVQVEFVAPGELKDLTGIETRQKPIRLIEARF